MEVRSDGSYKLKSGKVIPANKVGKLYRKAPLARKAQTEQEEEERNDELKEGQSSGVIDLCEG